MISGKSVLAIIPAREGSKRIPLKNITLFRGKALIQWAIEHAAGSKYIDATCISSDSDLILNHAKPPVIPIRRPDFLASDTATSEALIAHTLYFLWYSQGKSFDFFVLLQPTSPLRTPSDIDTCIERANSFSGRCLSWDEHGNRNGAVFVCSTNLFLSELQLESKRTGADYYRMPQSRSLDIDYEQDFAYKGDQDSLQRP